MRDLVKFILSKSKKVNDCIVWQGALIEGYGRIYKDKNHRFTRVHRVMYEAIKGKIPKGLVLDHLCRNRACVNVDHLEAVTDRVNLSRGFGASALNARKTHCKRGHEFTPENTNPWRGHRSCRLCHKILDRERRRLARELKAHLKFEGH